MNLDLPVDFRRYGSRPLWLLLAAAAASYSAERDVAIGAAAFLFWALLYGLCWNLRPALRSGPRAAQRVQQAGNLAAALGLLLFLFRLIQGDLVPAVLMLLFAGQAALLLIAEKRLHLWLLLAAALSGVLFAASASRSALFLPCAAWFSFAALGLLTADHALDRSLQAAAYALTVDEGQPQRIGRGGLAFTLLTLSLTLPLYLYLPRPEPLLLGGLQASSAADYRDKSESGQPLELDDGQSPSQSPAALPSANPAAAPGQASGTYGDSFPIQMGQADGSGLGNAVLMYVRSTQPVYLRGKLYARFQDDRWFRDRGTAQRREMRMGHYDSDMPPAGATQVKQQIEVVRALDASLYTAPGLQHLRFPGTVLRQYPDGTLEVPRRLLPDTTYSAESRLDLRDGRYLLRQERLADPAPYLQLPADLAPRIAELARQVSGGATDPAAKALAVEGYLRSNYQYSFDTIVPYQGVTPLDWFLFEHKRGHCEFFASAVVVMLRTLGIPARVATGYALGEKNPVTGFYEVRVLDGHAWGEVYLAGQGWMMLEPTAFYPLPPPRQSNQVAAQTDRYLDRMAITSAALQPGALRTAALAAARDAWQALRAVQRRILALLRGLGWWLPALMLSAAGLGLAARLLWLRLLDWTQNRRTLELLARAEVARDGTGALHAAAALEQGLAVRDLARPEWATFGEFCAQLQARHAAFPQGFAGLFDEVRYGAGSGTDAGSIAAVAALLRTELRRRPAPRFRHQLALWQGWLREFLGSLLPGS